MSFDKEAFQAWVDSNGEVPFDIHAQNPEDWSKLAELIPSLVISSAGGVFPFQAEGLLHGLPFYYREEHGYAELRVGEADGEAPMPWRCLYTARLDYAADHYGCIGMAGFQDFMVRLVPELKEASFLWEFPARELLFINQTDESGVPAYTVSEEINPKGVVGYGLTPEEGYKNSLRVIDLLVEKGGLQKFRRRCGGTVM